MKRGLIFLVILSIILVGKAVNLEQCLVDFKNEKLPNATVDDGRDNHGNTVSSFTNATALTYHACVKLCGAGQEPASWTVISQQFSAWLLPWLALLSQLPFGARDPLDNLGSIVLTVGSPTLAAYSLAITVMNGRWIAQHFDTVESDTAENVVRVLSRLQQSPLRIVEGQGLDSLVALRENDPWWEAMLKHLSVAHTWSISAVTSIAWVVIAYVFTVVDSFSPDSTQALNADGQGIGSQWLFLLAVVVGWLQLSPKCDADSAHQAFEETKHMVFVQDTSTSENKRLEDSSQHPLKLLKHIDWQSSLRRDEYRAPPMFNYARVLPWTLNVSKVSEAFRRAEPEQHPGMGDIWDSGVLWRIALSSFFALGLQWGTTGAALVVVMLTPTIGLGCRSASFLIYGGLSSVIWFFMMVSTFLTFGATRMYESQLTPTRSQRFTRFLFKWSAILLRRFCKLAAIINALWIIVFCFFQFTNFFNRCWCNGSVLKWGVDKAYIVIQFTTQDRSAMTQAWIGGVGLGVGSAAIFACFIALQLNPPMPKSRGSLIRENQRVESPQIPPNPTGYEALPSDSGQSPESSRIPPNSTGYEAIPSDSGQSPESSQIPLETIRSS
ncbi:hypothetical protein BDN72DRAFT_878497 [Pluteus cervinus]|uniref:Uncharacterized protein n=1 Tax=Pluteus cervinus TaxID=181527 RepID=A0ACD3AUS8_9AGAR|nr:hypothetical protein BDN72DRAFT_878497 [Pluteus cervinus]